MNVTSIEWTTFSSNPLKYRDASGRSVWGCVHASPGCLHCYSEAQAHRYQKGGPFNVPTMRALTPFLDGKELRHMLSAKVIKGVPVAGSRCFVGDMTDIFGEWVSDELLDRLFAVFAIRPSVTWQVLTKRAARMQAYVTALGTPAGYQRLEDAARSLGYTLRYRDTPLVPWPVPSVWLGVSCEDKKRFDERTPLLLQTPAAIRFVSLEPLISSIECQFPLKNYVKPGHSMSGADGLFYPALKGVPGMGPALDWVIVGGESGPRARPFDIEWARSILSQCKAAGVAAFLKQLGSSPEIAQGCGDCDPCLAGQRCYQSYNVGFGLRDRKGGDMSEWPEDLRVRQFPSTTRDRFLAGESIEELAASQGRSPAEIEDALRRT